MPWTNKHLEWLEDTGEKIVTKCGKSATVFRFAYDVNNDETMSAWAKHFRNHYCSDDAINFLKPSGKTTSEYLLELKFPSSNMKPGPSIRAGDFAEILVADYLEFLRGYYIPRTRYDRKTIGNESTKGSDVIAFKKHKEIPSTADELLVYEVKAKASENRPSNILQVAINDSSKDELRIAESLNAIKQRLYDKNEFAGVATVNRYQIGVDLPYKRSYGAAAIITESSYSSNELSKSDTSSHSANNNLELIVIFGKDLMPLIHALYERAANEI